MLDQENEEYLLQTVIEGYKIFFDNADSQSFFKDKNTYVSLL